MLFELTEYRATRARARLLPHVSSHVRSIAFNCWRCKYVVDFNCRLHDNSLIVAIEILCGFIQVFDDSSPIV